MKDEYDGKRNNQTIIVEPFDPKKILYNLIVPKT